jgi:hypothetical protein
MSQENNFIPDDEEEGKKVSGIKFTLKDLITIFAFLVSIVTAYTNVSERIVRNEQRIAYSAEAFGDLKDTIKRLDTELELYQKEDRRKIGEIEQTLFYIQQQLHRQGNTK